MKMTKAEFRKKHQNASFTPADIADIKNDADQVLTLDDVKGWHLFKIIKNEVSIFGFHTTMQDGKKIFIQ